VTHNGVEMVALVEELQVAQSELRDITAQGTMDAQGPLLQVLKVELLSEIKQVAEHVRQIRWLLQEMREKESDCNASEDGTREPEQELKGRFAPSLMEQVEELVRTKLSDQKGRRVNVEQEEDLNG
jgi:hypothetical protein